MKAAITKFAAFATDLDHYWPGLFLGVGGLVVWTLLWVALALACKAMTRPAGWRHRLRPVARPENLGTGHARSTDP